MKPIRVISIIGILFAIGYLCYIKYARDIEMAYYLGGVDERATLFSLMAIEKTNKSYDFDKYIKSTIAFDLDVLNNYQDIKSKIDLKKYCETITYTQNDFNASVLKKINLLCGGSMGNR